MKMVCFMLYTGFGDYPHQIPTKKMKDYKDYQPKWMLLSYNKPVEVSSDVDGHAKELAVNEDVRTYWSAASGNREEWSLVDLEGVYDVGGLQVNFAEEGTSLVGRAEDIYYQYKVEYSNDKKIWKS